jgi:hypothetical protein
MQSRLHTSPGFAGLDGSGLMFVKSFVTPFRSALLALRLTPVASRVPPPRSREDWVAPFAACAARAHFLVAPSPEREAAVHGHARLSLASARVFAVNAARRAGKLAARAALRVAYAGSPLTPTGYAILVLTVTAVALVAMLSTSSVGNELGRTMRLSWWFS